MEREISLTVIDKLPDNIKNAASANKDSNDVEHIVSTIYKEALDAGAVAHNACLLKCNVPTSSLLVGKDGKFQGTIVDGGKKFKGQARFTANDVRPMALFKLASAVTGQYDYCIIMRKLDNIEEGISEIRWTLENDKYAVLLQCYNMLHMLAAMKSFHESDMVRIDSIIDKTGTLFNGYVRQMEHIQQEVKHVSYSNCWNTAYSRFSRKFSHFCNLGYEACVDGLKASLVLYLASLNVKMRMISLMNSNDGTYSEDISMTYKEFQRVVSMNICSLIDGVRDKLIPVLQHFRDHAWFMKGNMTEKIAKSKMSFFELNRYMKTLSSSFSKLTEVETYLEIDKDGNAKLIGYKEASGEI